MFERTTHGSDAIHGSGSIIWVVPHSGDRTVGQSLGVDDFQTHRLSGSEPPAHFAAWSAGSSDIEPRRSTIVIRSPTREPIPHFGSILLPFRSEATLKILMLVPFSNAGAISEGNRRGEK